MVRFFQQHLIRNAHQGVLHFVFKLGYQLNTIDENYAEDVFVDACLLCLPLIFLIFLRKKFVYVEKYCEICIVIVS